MRNGSCFERPTLELPTSASESSSWPTIRAEDAESCGQHPGATDSLNKTAELWSTPRTITGGGESAERKQELGRTEAGGGDLQSQSEAWPTPGANDHKGSANPGQRRGQLDEATAGGGGSVSRGHEQKDEALIAGQASSLCSRLDRASSRNGDGSSPCARTSRPRLNHRFVSGLMGLPYWWVEG